MKVPPETKHDHLLEGQAKPTGQQLLWVFTHLAEVWDTGESYGHMMERMYGFPAAEKVIAHGPGQGLTNIINCARESEEVKKCVWECYL